MIGAFGDENTDLFLSLGAMAVIGTLTEPDGPDGARGKEESLLTPGGYIGVRLHARLTDRVAFLLRGTARANSTGHAGGGVTMGFALHL